jgi:DNA-binding CsgD family transcriptional regulator
MTAARRSGKNLSKAERALIEEQVTALKLGGANYPQIAKQLDIAVSTAWSTWKRVVERAAIVSERDATREHQLALLRLDRLIAKAWSIMVDPASSKFLVLNAIKTVLKLEERRAKLLGIDAPVRLVHTGPDGGPIEHHSVTESEGDVEIRRLLGGMAAREASCAAPGPLELPSGFDSPLRLDAGPETD